jgi:hypothetical protein
MHRIFAVAITLTSLAAGAQAPDAPKAAPSVDAMLQADVNTFSTEGLSRVELQKLRFRLDEQRPGLVSPIVTLSGGAALAFLGLAGLVTGVIGLTAPGQNEFKRYAAGDPFGGPVGMQPTGLGYFVITAGVVFSLAGAALTTLGTMWLKSTLAERKLAAFKLELVDEALAKTPALSTP